MSGLYVFDGVEDYSLKQEVVRVEIIMAHTGQRMAWLEMMLVENANCPEELAYDAALSDEQDQQMENIEYLYALEGELIERGVKGWVSS